MHGLHATLVAAANGHFPPVDGAVDVQAPGPDGTLGAVEFTGHAVVVTTRDPGEVRRRAVDGFGGATDVDFMRWLAGPTGWVGSHDAVLVGRGAGGSPMLDERTDLDDHPRVLRARHHRSDVRVAGDETGFVTLGSGLVGRTEMSVELLHDRPGRGDGRGLIAAGLTRVPHDELVWAQVAPGNAASFRAFLRCGFVLIGAERLVGSAT